MGSVERSKKKVLLWKKAIVHFSLCFVMGFFSGFAPTGKGSVFSSHNLVAKENKSEIINSPRSVHTLNQSATAVQHSGSNVNRSLRAETPVPAPAKSEELLEIPKPKLKLVDFNEVKFPPKRLLIIVTPTSTRDRSSNHAQKDECLQINQFNGLPLALNHYLSFCYNQFPNNLLKAQTPKLMVTEPPKLMSLKFYIFINLVSKF